MKKVFFLSGIFFLLFCKSAHAQTFPDQGFSTFNIASGWVQPVGVQFSTNGQQLFVWEKEGKVYVCNRNGSGVYVKQSAPVLDISAEVLNWRDHGLLSFALDPNFASNGFIYLLYVVDRRFLMNDNSIPADGNYSGLGKATIGRVTRYQTITNAGVMGIVGGSGTILLGETPSTGIAILHESHGVGTLAFASDGTLLISAGDGASYLGVDNGSQSTTYYTQALGDGIIRAAENVGAFRAQMLNSHNGKLLRIDPATGDGISSNPFYSAAAPRSPKSRVWALGFRNPFRFSVRPGTGSADPTAGDIGEVYVGDVGWYTYEELSIIKAPGMNCGWPVFEGHNFGTDYTFYPQNSDEPNPLFNGGSCNQQYFTFGNLIKQATADDIKTVFNPCNASVAIGTHNRYFHRRPAIDWHHEQEIARVGIFNGNNAAVATIGTPASNVTGTPFRGNCAGGGCWYTGNLFPVNFRNTFFQAEFGEQWIKSMRIDFTDVVQEVQNFASALGQDAVVCLTENPLDGTLVYVNIAAGLIKGITYGGNQFPVVKMSSDNTYGPSPLTVNFTGNTSFDPDGTIASYAWNFGDPASGANNTSALANPFHTFTFASGPKKYVVKLTVTDAGNPVKSSTDSIIVSVNNTPPVVNITSPIDNSTYTVGGEATYPLTATVTDTEHNQGQLKYAWQTILRHNNHEHAEPIDTNRNSQTQISLVGCNGEDYYWFIKLTVTDAAGLSTTDSSKIFPACGPDNTPPTIISVSPLNGATGVSVSTAVSAIFNEAMNASTINSSTIELRNPANALITATVSYNAGTRTVTLTPSAALANATVYTAKIKGGTTGVKDVAGNALASDSIWSFTTETVTSQPLSIQSVDTKTSGTSATIHSLIGVPAGALLVLTTTMNTNNPPSNCIVSSSPSLTWTKRADAGATNSNNSEIWTAVFAAGGSISVTSNWGAASQASVCYVVLNAESVLGGASGTAVSQSAPSVTITTTRANSIIFGCTADWNAIDGTARTLRDGATERLYFADIHYTTYFYTKAAGAIGAYTEGVGLPTGQQASTALLEIRGTTAVDITAPTVTSVSPLNGATGVSTSTAVSAIFNEAMNASTINGTTIELRNPTSALITATVSYNAGTNTATLTPSAALANSTVYTATIKSGASGVKDVAGNPLASDQIWSFTTAAADVTPPTVTSVTPLNGATGAGINTTVSTIFNEAMNAATINGTTIELRNPASALITATVSYNAGTNTATLTPSAALANSTVYTATIKSGASGVKDVAGNPLASDQIWSFTTEAVSSQPVSIQSLDTKTSSTSATTHSLTGVPAGALLVLTTTMNTNNPPSNCIVSSSPSLTWTKRADAGATNSNNAEIWTAVFATGGSISVTSNWGAESQASVCYVVLNAESALGGASGTGVSQAAPSVTLTTTRANSIIFGCTADWNAIDGTARTLRDGATERLYFADIHYTTYFYTKAAGAIGAYTEGVSFPTGQQASTALLEIRGTTGGPDVTPPTVTSVSPLNGATGVSTSTAVSAIFNEAMNASTINGTTIELRNPTSALITATVSYNAGTNTATLTPSAALANSTVYTATIKSGASGVKDVAGNPLASDQIWSFTTAAADVTPPTVTSVTPLNGATGAGINTTVSTIFNEAMNAATINGTTIELRNPASALITATVSYNAGTNTATLTPSAALANSTVYTATIKSGASGVKDVAGNPLASDQIWSFTTAAADVTPPTVTSVTPLNGATGAGINTTVSTIFNEAMNAATINGTTIELRNPASALITATVSYNAGTNTATLTPSAALANSTVYTATIKSGASGVKDVAGNPLASDQIWSFTTEAVSSQPVSIQSLDTKTSSTSATTHSLTGVPAGALLVLTTTMNTNNPPSNCIVSSSPSLTWTKRADAGATNSNNAEIWTAVFATGGSISVTSNWGAESQASVCYVVLNAESALGGASGTGVSQAAPSVTLTTTRANSIIFGCTADWNAIDGTARTLRDGATERLYFADIHYTTYFYTKAAGAIGAYTEGVSFPTGQQASTALLEIRGTTGGPDVTPPTVTSVSPLNGATGVGITTTVSAIFNEAMNAATINGATIELRNPASALITATVSYNAGTNTATLTPSAALANSTVYTATIKSGASGVKDVAGNPLASDHIWSFTTAAADVTPPTVTSVTPLNGATGVSTSTAVSAIFSEAMNAATINGATIELRNPASALITATVSYNAGTNTATLTPSAALANSTVYTATIKSGASGVKDVAGNPLASDHIWSFTTGAAASVTYNIFSPTSSGPNQGATAREVGVKFRVTQAGNITGIRFYKGTPNTGTHTGNLWSNTGTNLASVTFTGETASGWQQALFASPVAVTPGVTYIASYFTPTGNHAITTNFFTAAVVNGPLRALASSEDGGNGVFKNSAVTTFPNTSSGLLSNFWVDVVFTTDISARLMTQQSSPQETLMQKLVVKITPNPSSGFFNLIAISDDKAPVSVRILDISGELLEYYEKITAGSLLQVGQLLKGGIYFAEIIQRDQRKVMKIIKTN